MTIVEKQFLRKFDISSWPKPPSKAVRISSRVYFRNQRVVYLWHKVCTRVNKHKTRQNTFYTLQEYVEGNGTSSTVQRRIAIREIDLFVLYV